MTTTTTPALTASVERVIAAPAAKIFALLADPARHSEFDGSGTVRGAKGAAHGSLKLGDTFGMDMHMGMDYSMLNTVVEFEQDRRIAWQTTVDKPIVKHLAGGRIWRYTLEPVDGGTKVTETWDVREEKGVKWLVFYAGRAKTMKNMAATLARIEQVLAA